MIERHPSHAPHEFDVAIVGAGPVGLALAAWLARRSASAALSVALVDARDPEAAAGDPRAIAISEGSRMLLEPFGAWPADANAIERIHVSQRGRFGRTLIERGEHGLPALGYVVRYGSIVHALAGAVRRTGTHWFTSCRALPPHVEPGSEFVTLPIESAHVQRTLRARVLINAEGGLYGETHAKRSHPAVADTDTDTGDHGQPQMAARAASPANTADADATSAPAPARERAKRETRDYGQTAIVGIVTVSAAQPHVAWERFTDEGPIALLPMGGVRGADYALVWCMQPAQAARRGALSDAALLAELGIAFGERMGRFESIKGRAAFPLGLVAAQALVEGRIASIGNAAQTLHPVAGQGLNLGLRDAHALADALAGAGATPEALAQFARRRAFDRRMTIGATDTLARLFTIDFGPLAMLRGLALTALECVPPAKTALARQMMFGQRR
ncbi:UbiH/UbiF/VisC/COQ6 family ubiquinone biosynthesis hydroxylase [Trinickia dinghuensis]|uniref:UbiH/UbiF/VisC/COQ6 family ubiquinone biosynthesis hydroxylase n=1 Tax=Trinickia dinghuensis TaxID=2291023 RepID=A0A3D8JQH2_9BURK|nr:UbiH/UbiF/VisC/COQ6 family ubiquinone biosynthesis hydroxylase [Trinickia dinghuensis]RDU94794.1 UbiH/UbiF/VisC/COQ6 family ubiquinone biosynthesis hydroxylase [Trinickia dinghuensis]